MTDKPVAWEYQIQYGPDGEDNYAWVYRDKVMVATMRTHNAKEIVGTMSIDFTAMKERAEAAEAESLEQARIIGMGAERELALKAELERTQRNRDMWKGQCDRQAKEYDNLDTPLYATPPDAAERIHPYVSVNEDAGISEMHIEDCATITGQEMIVRPLLKMEDRSQIVGFQWWTGSESDNPANTQQEHDVGLKADLQKVADSLSSRPAELRGPFGTARPPGPAMEPVRDPGEDEQTWISTAAPLSGLDITKEWFEKQSAKEGDLEIGAGRLPDYIPGFIPSAADRHYNSLFAGLQERIRQLEAERDEWKSEYFRRHKDAADNAERAILAELKIRRLEADKEELVDAVRKASDVMVVLANAVFNDNGDMTVTLPILNYDTCIQAYFLRKKVAALIAKHGGGNAE